MIQNAITLASIAHTGQLRKGTNNPYIVHPLRVKTILSELKCSEIVMVAGLLHDTVEEL